VFGVRRVVFMNEVDMRPRGIGSVVHPSSCRPRGRRETRCGGA
jgi:hypothetical protein